MLIYLVGKLLGFKLEFLFNSPWFLCCLLGEECWYCVGGIFKVVTNKDQYYHMWCNSASLGTHIHKYSGLY